MKRIDTNLILGDLESKYIDISNKYDYRKYPKCDYENFRESFSLLKCNNSDIESALKWKWGHWGKLNYPNSHKLLIGEVQRLWPKFVGGCIDSNPYETYQWWKMSLNKNTRFITVAYITHLVHYKELIPIIDQHNFRAMNFYISRSSDGASYNKNPSNWDDIMLLKEFMSLVCEKMPTLSFSDLDKFLMVFGRDLKRK